MDTRMHVVVEMYEEAISRMLERTLADLEAGETEWRPLPESNNIALIVRHLAIEARWHLDCLEHGAAMPADPSLERRRDIDAVPIDCAANLGELRRCLTRFLELLREMSDEQLLARSASAYGQRAAARPRLLGYHQAIHLFHHLGQIAMVRNLYRRTKGHPRFIPQNPTFPSQ